MVIRKIIIALAVIVMLVGLSQLIATRWWLDTARTLVDSDHLNLWGLVGVVFGVILLIAALEGAVGLRAFVAILGLLSLGAGAALLVNPQFLRDVLYAVVFDRSHGFQVFMTWVGGLVRVMIGAALIYAVFTPAQQASTASAQAPPEP